MELDEVEYYVNILSKLLIECNFYCIRGCNHYKPIKENVFSCNLKSYLLKIKTFTNNYNLYSGFRMNMFYKYLF